MSTVAQAAELDAAIGEHELTDDEAERLRAIVAEEVPVSEALEQVLGEREPEPKPPSAPEPEPEALGEPSEKQLRELDRENTRHITKVQTVMGGFVAGWATCEKCDGLGLSEPGPQPKTNERYRECPVCAGFARVLTGSRDPSFAFAPCPGCGGRGFQERIQTGEARDGALGAPAPIPGAAPLAPAAPSSPPVPSNGSAEDEWGTPAWMGDPNLNAGA